MRAIASETLLFAGNCERAVFFPLRGVSEFYTLPGMQRIIVICRTCRADQPFVAPSVPELSRAIRDAGWVEAIGPDAGWAVGGYSPTDRPGAEARAAA